MAISEPLRGTIPLDVSLVELVSAQARRNPEQVALLSDTASLTYGELERRTNQLAASLRAEGVQPGDCVGVHMGHSVEAIVAFVGVLKCGAAYLPTALDSPAMRLGAIFRDAGVKVVFTHPHTAPGLQGLGVASRVLEPGLKSLDPWEAVAPPAAAFPDSVAYVIYTSGSTGEPKGVFVPHRGMVNLCQAVIELWQLRPGDRAHLFPPLNFDSAGETLFATLAAGATVVLRSEHVPSPMEYTEVIERFGLTCLVLPPIYLHQWLLELVRRGARIPGSVRMACMGGDKLALETRRLWREAGGENLPWINDYGPTETTVTAVNGPCGDEPGPPGISFFPIGRPLPNVRAYLLAAGLHPVEKGEPGELYISGAGVAYGYWNRPAETAERFLPDPWSPVPGARMYRTGDLVRELPDGRLLFLGRGDDQVKIRGYRVELQEVELTLRRHAAVRDVTVVARPGSSDELRLIAYWVSQGEPPPESELRAFLRERLPEYMVPSAWVRLDELPLTPNGKVDRRALPPPPAPARQEHSLSSPSSPTEQLLADLCFQVIGARVELKDNFFEAGGNSLQAMQLVSQIEGTFKLVVPIQVIFEAATLQDIIREVDLLVAESRIDTLSGEELDALLRQMQQTGS
jgi:amino acid adenylation domain-containing protein